MLQGTSRGEPQWFAYNPRAGGLFHASLMYGRLMEPIADPGAYAAQRDRPVGIVDWGSFAAVAIVYVLMLYVLYLVMKSRGA